MVAEVLPLLRPYFFAVWKGFEYSIDDVRNTRKFYKNSALREHSMLDNGQKKTARDIKTVPVWILDPQDLPDRDMKFYKVSHPRNHGVRKLAINFLWDIKLFKLSLRSTIFRIYRLICIYTEISFLLIRIYNYYYFNFY